MLSLVVFRRTRYYYMVLKYNFASVKFNYAWLLVVALKFEYEVQFEIQWLVPTTYRIMFIRAMF